MLEKEIKLNGIKITIIVIVYNIEKRFINKCIKSLVDSCEHSNDVEIIVVDDGSKCDIAEECDVIAKKYSFVKVIHQENGGSSVARNTGIDNAQGDWICFVDGDDWVEKNYVSVIKSNIDEKYDAIWFNHYDVNNQNKSVKCFGENKIFTVKDKKNCQLAVFQQIDYLDKYPMFFGAVWEAAYKKELLDSESIRFIKGLSRAQDAVFNLYFLEHCKSIKYVDSALYNYRIYNDSVCHKYTDRTVAYQNLFNEFKSFLVIYNKDADYWDAYCFFGFRYFLEILKLNYYHKEYPYTWSKAENELCCLLSETPFNEIIYSVDLRFLTAKRKFVLGLIRHRKFHLLKQLSRISQRFLM